jgi:aryl-alcohol dehydrogenase-like predicted oxidoreductase
MKNKRLGNSDLYITPTGFGAWAIGGSGWEFAWRQQDDWTSIEAIHRASWARETRSRRKE